MMRSQAMHACANSSVKWGALCVMLAREFVSFLLFDKVCYELIYLSSWSSNSHEGAVCEVASLTEKWNIDYITRYCENQNHTGSKQCCMHTLQSVALSHP